MKKSEVTRAYLEQAQIEHEIALAEEDPTTTDAQRAVLQGQRDRAAEALQDIHARWQLENPE